jgi:hypothetical protein
VQPGVEAKVEVEEEIERTYLNPEPYLRTESAAVYIHADCEPRSAVRRRHFVEHFTRLRGRLDAMQTHVAPELDSQSELRFEYSQLVRKGRREGRQRATVGPSD